MSTPVRCSWCQKTSELVRKVIVGPDASICDQCIVLCAAVVSNEIPTFNDELRAMREFLNRSDRKNPFAL